MSEKAQKKLVTINGSLVLFVLVGVPRKLQKGIASAILGQKSCANV